MSQAQRRLNSLNARVSTLTDIERKERDLLKRICAQQSAPKPPRKINFAPPTENEIADKRFRLSLPFIKNSQEQLEARAHKIESLIAPSASLLEQLEGIYYVLEDKFDVHRYDHVSLNPLALNRPA